MAREFVFKFHPGQAAIYNSPARFKVVAAGRRFGKSHFAAIMLGIAGMQTTNARGYDLTDEHGVYYVAPTADQGRRVMWPKLRNLLGYERTGGWIRNENVNDGWLELINGRRIYIKGAEDPDRLRGIGLSFVVLDEYADMKASVWDEIIDPALMDVEGDALFIGTPKGKNHFYKLFMGALHKPIDPRTGYNAWEDWEAFHFKSSDNVFLSAKELRRISNDPRKTREQIDQEINASFLSGGGKVLKPDNFIIIPANKVPSLPYQSFVTVDLAGFEKTDGKKVAKLDEHAIATTLVMEDKWYIWNIKHGQWDTRQTAFNIVTELRRTPGARLGIEKGALANAVGPYLEDYMRELGRYVTPEPLSHGNTRKQDRIEWALAGRSQRGQIHLVEGPWNDAFLEQVSDFPDPLAHDDLLDAPAYVDQMSRANYVTSHDIEEWEPLDLDSGY